MILGNLFFLIREGLLGFSGLTELITKDVFGGNYIILEYSEVSYLNVERKIFKFHSRSTQFESI